MESMFPSAVKAGISPPAPVRTLKPCLPPSPRQTVAPETSRRCISTACGMLWAGFLLLWRRTWTPPPSSYHSSFLPSEVNRGLSETAPLTLPSPLLTHSPTKRDKTRRAGEKAACWSNLCTCLQYLQKSYGLILCFPLLRRPEKRHVLMILHTWELLFTISS